MILADYILKAIKEASQTTGLPYDLLYGIVCQESSGIPGATRYEPGFFKQYICRGWVAALLAKLKVGVWSKEGRGRATSWGLMQIMGQTAREEGFTGEFEQLLEPRVGLHWGCRHLRILTKRYLATYGWPGVIAAYNAGTPRKKGGVYVNQPYVNGVFRHSRDARWPL